MEHKVMVRMKKIVGSDVYVILIYFLTKGKPFFWQNANNFDAKFHCPLIAIKVVYESVHCDQF